MNNSSSTRYPNPTAADQADFLLRLYFGSGDDLLDRAIRRAHQDLSRTVHGIGEHPEARPKAANVLRDSLAELATTPPPETQAFFDTWHRETCEQLCRAYADAGYPKFTIGQAQKWLNMAVKYVFVFGEARLPGYERFFRLAHVPIDNIILQSRAFDGLRTFRERWSRIRDYADYLAFQQSVRERFPNSAPLAVEFWEWQASEGGDAP